MKVKIIPIRPIPGILPKNKWIDTEIILDLNKKEIIHCMQYGNVYDFLDNVIDTNYLAAFDDHLKAYYYQTIESKPEFQSTVLTVSTSDEPIVIDMSQDIPDEVIINEETETDDFTKIYPYTLDVISCEKEDEYIILETQFNCNYSEKITGRSSLYGLFICTSGDKPSVEYKKNDNWKKFNNIFSNFNELQNGTKFIFRFIPKNNSEVQFDLSIKNGKELLSIISIAIDPEEL